MDIERSHNRDRTIIWTQRKPRTIRKVFRAVWTACHAGAAYFAMFGLLELSDNKTQDFFVCSALAVGCLFLAKLSRRLRP